MKSCSFITRLRLLCICLLLTFVGIEGYAQKLSLDITVNVIKRVRKSKVNSSGDTVRVEEEEVKKGIKIPIYAFAGKRAAESLAEKMRNDPSQDVWEKVGALDVKKTSDRAGSLGVAHLVNVTQDDYLLIDLSRTEISIEDSTALQIIKISSLNLETVGDPANRHFSAVFEVKIKSTDIEGTEVSKKRQVRVNPVIIALRTDKDEISFEVTACLDSAYARGGARFGFVPRLVRDDPSFTEVAKLRASVVDGRKYHREMKRRMGNDLRHDRYYEYSKSVFDSLFMEERKDTSWTYKVTYKPFDFSKKHLAISYEWYEDFKSVYHEDSRIVWPGRWVEYGMFINWSDVLSSMEIRLKPERYSKDETANRKEESDAYHLQFKYNSEELDDNDSSTVNEYRRLQQLIGKYQSGENGASLTPKAIIAYSSPEGSERGNRDLAQRRAQSLRSRLHRQFPYSNFSGVALSSDIVPWSEVVDTLMSRGAKGDERAKEIVPQLQDIVNKYKTLDAQFAAIRNQPWFKSYIDPEILPKMRRCEFKYEAVLFKILTPEECMEKYEFLRRTNSLNKLFGNEFFHVMNSLAEEERWKELEEVASVARNASDCMEREVVRTDLDTTVYHTRNFKDARRYVVNNILSQTQRDSLRLKADSVENEFRKNGEVRKVEIDEVYTMTDIKTDTMECSRRDPLASYYYVLAKLKQGQADTGVLDDYFDFLNAGYEREYIDFDGGHRGWWNDEAFVVLQAVSCCQNDEFNKANTVLYEHLRDFDKDIPKYERLKSFIAFLGGNRSKEKMDEMERSSPMNAVLVNIAKGEKENNMEYFQNARKILSGDYEWRPEWGETEIDTSDARVLYLETMARYKVDFTESDRTEHSPLPMASVMYAPDVDPLDPGAKTANMAAPLLEAFRRSPGLYTFFQHDGFFATPFHVLVDYFWKRVQDGADMESIAREYTVLKSKYDKR